MATSAAVQLGSIPVSSIACSVKFREVSTSVPPGTHFNGARPPVLVAKVGHTGWAVLQAAVGRAGCLGCPGSSVGIPGWLAIALIPHAISIVARVA